MADTVNHTPGPWEARKASNGDHGIMARGTGVFVEAFTEIRHSREGAYDECVANARLIAAAPELLEFSKLYMAAVQQINDAMKDGMNVHGAIAELIGAEDMLNHAIAKAEGRS